MNLNHFTVKAQEAVVDAQGLVIKSIGKYPTLVSGHDGAWSYGAGI